MPKADVFVDEISVTLVLLQEIRRVPPERFGGRVGSEY